MVDLFVGHADAVFDLATTPDQRYLVTVSADKTAKIWDVEKRTSQTLEVGGRVWGAALSPDGRRLATASDDGKIRLWKVQDATPDGAPLKLFKSPMYGVAFSPDGKHLAAVGERGTAIYLLDSLSAPRWRLTDHQGTVYRTSFSMPMAPSSLPRASMRGRSSMIFRSPDHLFS